MYDVSNDVWRWTLGWCGTNLLLFLYHPQNCVHSLILQVPGHTIAVLFVQLATFYALKEVIGSGTMPSSCYYGEEKNANCQSKPIPLGYDSISKGCKISVIYITFCMPTIREGTFYGFRMNFEGVQLSLGRRFDAFKTPLIPATTDQFILLPAISPTNVNVVKLASLFVPKTALL